MGDPDVIDLDNPVLRRLDAELQERAAEADYNAWWEEKKAQGFHPPEECPCKNGHDNVLPPSCARCGAVGNGRCPKCRETFANLPEGMKALCRDRIRAIHLVYKEELHVLREALANLSRDLAPKEREENEDAPEWWKGTRLVWWANPRAIEAVAMRAAHVVEELQWSETAEEDKARYRRFASRLLCAAARSLGINEADDVPKFVDALGDRLRPLYKQLIDAEVLHSAEQSAWETLNDFAARGECPAPIGDHFQVYVQHPSVGPTPTGDPCVVRVVVLHKTEQARLFLEAEEGCYPTLSWRGEVKDGD